MLKVNYHEYINSYEWKNKGRIFLKKVGRRCQIFPWIKLKKYNIHHCTYKNLGNERWNIDCIVLSKTAHNLIHGWLAGSLTVIRVSEQNKNPKNKYPNTCQKIIHIYAIIVGFLLYLIKFI
ncbi:MAG: hypothetical protein F6K08_00050 [Okeania sp. SIO1H6]|nr:hypothetical protein [Okeania sp. SIO1H6]